MSLLLEALKRAEKAKHKSAMDGATDEPASGAEESTAAVSPAESNLLAAEKSIMPGDELVDQYLHSVNEDPTPPEATNASPSYRPDFTNLKPTAPFIATNRPAAASPSANQTNEQQRATRQFFAAKSPVSYANKILVGSVALFFIVAIGSIYYYWKMLNPPTPSFAANIPPPQLPAPSKPIARIEPPVAETTITLSDEAPVAEPVEVEKPVVARVSPTMKITPPIPTEKFAQASAPTVVAAPDNNIKISRNSNQNIVSPVLNSAYQAYLSGNTAAAQSDYRKVLQNDPRNHDAMVGLAAIAVKQNQTEQAEAMYLRMLELDPKDAMAQAGLISISGQRDPGQSESRLKTLLAQQPNTAYLNFTLGNLYANQSRWAEAQQAFFHAYTREADDPDYAYNLAVSLDHLSQQKAAVEYYQRALALSDKRAAVFDRKQLLARIRELTR